jgi:hypothetical protein
MPVPTVKEIKQARFSVQVIASTAAVCAIVGAINIWDVWLFPPTMSASCAMTIERNPLENFSFIDESARQATLECLHEKWRYNQTTWKVNPNYAPRTGER